MIIIVNISPKTIAFPGVIFSKKKLLYFEFTPCSANPQAPTMMWATVDIIRPKLRTPKGFTKFLGISESCSMNKNTPIAKDELIKLLGMANGKKAMLMYFSYVFSEI